MTNWKIKVEDEDSKPLESILSEGSKFIPSFNSNRSRINPFLDSEPIENLEQDLGQITDKEDKKENAFEQPILYNAPNYSGNYNSGDYESINRKSNIQRDVSGGSLMNPENVIKESAIHVGEQRRMDLNAWQQQNMDQFDSDSEKYQMGRPEQFKQDDDLPFQAESKPKRFFWIIKDS